MTSSELKNFLLIVRHNEVHHTGTVLLESERLKQQEVAFSGDILLNIDQSVGIAVGPEDIWIRLLADFALELLPGIRNQVLLFLLCHLLLQPVLQALVVDISHRPITLAGVEKRVLLRRIVVPADLALNIRTHFWVDNSAVNFNGFFLELFPERVDTLVVHDLLDGAVIGLMDLLIFWVLCALNSGSAELGSEVLHIEFYPAKLDDVSTVEFVVQVILCALGVPDDDEHLVVDVLVRDRVPFTVPGRLRHNRIVLDLELT